jgi:hypothetical protein
MTENPHGCAEPPFGRFHLPATSFPPDTWHILPNPSEGRVAAVSQRNSSRLRSVPLRFVADATLFPSQLIFLASPDTRKQLGLPSQDRVDFRAVCFCHHRVVDMGFVCSVCLSSESRPRSLFPFVTPSELIVPIPSSLLRTKTAVYDVQVRADWRRSMRPRERSADETILCPRSRFPMQSVLQLKKSLPAALIQSITAPRPNQTTVSSPLAK